VANNAAQAGTENLTTLVGEIADDARHLVERQLDLLRAEVREGVGEVIGAGESVAAGAGLLAAGGLLSVVAVAQAAHKLTGLPQWACYGLAAGAAGVGGVALVERGRRRLAGLRLLPQTAEALEENVRWVRQQVAPTPG
jgi:Putative Actinobacterial Holin-X, holin superfamily III